MKKPHRTYEVYRDGIYMDDSWAVSEAQAINNVRHNMVGDFESQHSEEHVWEAELKYGSNTAKANG